MKPRFGKVVAEFISVICKFLLFVSVVALIIYGLSLVIYFIKMLNWPPVVFAVLFTSTVFFLLVGGIAYSIAQSKANEEFYSTRIQTDQGFLTYEEFVVKAQLIEYLILEQLGRFTNEQKVHMIDSLPHDGEFNTAWDINPMDGCSSFLNVPPVGYETILEQVTELFPSAFKIGIPFDNPYDE